MINPMTHTGIMRSPSGASRAYCKAAPRLKNNKNIQNPKKLFRIEDLRMNYSTEVNAGE